MAQIQICHRILFNHWYSVYSMLRVVSTSAFFVPPVFFFDETKINKCFRWYIYMYVWFLFWLRMVSVLSSSLNFFFLVVFHFFFMVVNRPKWDIIHDTEWKYIYTLLEWQFLHTLDITYRNKSSGSSIDREWPRDNTRYVYNKQNIRKDYFRKQITIIYFYMIWTLNTLTQIVF